ncbi:MAG: hypothetical protein HOP17_02135 [Acidobacteria bacterium]|nr:hypothetical protein [Acidobacteriota bacterium]
MKIHDDHLYHGAALTQIAEHKQFTAINAFKLKVGASRSAFVINDEIGVYLKYATKPMPAYKEYPFTFRSEHLEELASISKKCKSVFAALVCVKDRQICCLSYEELLQLVEKRKRSRGSNEDQYTVLATLPENKSFRVYVSPAGAKKSILGSPIIISRRAFPDRIFE